MKLAIEKRLIEIGAFAQSDTYRQIYQNIIDGIHTVSWADPREFVINPVPKANGVLPIKNNFIAHLVRQGVGVRSINVSD